MNELAEALRPQTLADIQGQEHVLGVGKVLRAMIERNMVKNSIIWGPPGSGKTTLIRMIAKTINVEFIQLNATTMTAANLRSSLIDGALVLLDELHRAPKNIQDILLPALEERKVLFFGATTETPRFAVNKTILSRCHIFELNPICEPALLKILLSAKEYYKNKGLKIRISKDAAKTLITRSNGDARKLLSVLEILVDCYSENSQLLITIGQIDNIIPGKHVIFDAKGSGRPDFAHCYQDAIQDSDADGAIYWLAAWLNSGEDPAYICRRMLISAFEDCAGNPFAITSAMAACYATERTGMPECMIAMAQATCEMATSKRNKSAFYAIHAAMADVQNKRTVHVLPEMRAGNNAYKRIINKKYVIGFEKDAPGLNPDA